MATPLELLTDLCFVVAVAQAATGLHHAISEGHAASGVGHFAMAFFAIWWTWLNFTWFTSAYDNDDGIARLLTIFQILGSLVLAAGIVRFFNDDALLIIVGYVIMRIALVIQWLRVSRNDPEHALTARRYALGIVLVQIGWIGFYFVPSAVYVPTFLVLVLCEFAVPIWSEKPGMTPWHPHHIAERYSLFFIIVLGETILSTTIAIQDAVDGEHPAAQVTYVVIGGILIVFSLWWLYFQRNAGEVIGGDNVSPFVWGFGHYFIFAAAAAIGAGLASRVDFWTHHGDGSALVTGAAVTVPVAVILAALWFIHIRLHDSSVRTLVPFSVAIVVVLGGTYTAVPELVAGLACAALLAVELILTEGKSETV
ncbi:membrane protein [Rhodococcus qingshengii]|nr:membrane protein [Rhodococcus qingshengii]SCC42908.1 Low temperature requirement protein LtrA [Rhodococcus qingshengii]